MSGKEESPGELRPDEAGRRPSSGPDPAGSDLPPSLKSFEARLASLPPRGDRLDRDRLMFRAGQISVAGEAGSRPVPGRSLAWPTSLAGMTALAATFLVMLIVRPEPPVVQRTRIVKVPVQGEEAGAEERTFEPRVRRGALASRHVDWLLYSERGPFPSRAVYLEVVGRMLADGADPWASPAPPPKGGDRPESPIPYHQRLKTLLEDQARAALPGDWLHPSLNSGAKS